ncbi:septum formation family protein [Lacisediminihabitans sp. H27-G8]|uniref:septum formation family protein n=1 Tax=Lacisediminihabitans sp. H27-G8 TaxID=3111909 RepID=UPI0038FC4668
MKQSRILRVVAAGLLIPGLLSGCAFLPLVNTVAEKVNGSSVLPSVGDCWHTDFTTIDSDYTWTSGHPVDCATDHQSYTYAVPVLAKSLPRTLVDDSTGSVRDDIDSAAFESCDAASAHFLPSSTLQESRLEPGYFLPSEAAWAAGARWVRCDFAIIAYGSSFSDPRLEKLPAKISEFVRDAESRPEIFALCVNTTESTDSSDPFSSDSATYADCAKDPQWREASEDALPGDDGAPFPSEKVRNAFDQAHCGDPADAAGVVWVTYEPTADTWKSGDRIVECWVATAPSGPTA